MRSDERSKAAGTAGATTWNRPAAWRGAALAWADEELDRAGLVRTGELEQPHVYPGSTALRLPVGDSAVWLKSVGPARQHEPALSAALGRWVPDHVLVPLAVEPDRRLMLLPDGGRTLHDAGGSTRVVAWNWMLRTYTRLQLELVPHAAEMLALGVPDHRPSRLPALVADLLADDDARLTVARVDSRRRSAIVWWPTSGSPWSTAHASPTVASPRRSARRAGRRERVRVGEPAPVLRLGDASVSHPFVRLLATLRMVARALDLENGRSGPAAALRIPLSTRGAATGHRSSCASSAPHEPGPLTPPPVAADIGGDCTDGRERRRLPGPARSAAPSP